MSFADVAWVQHDEPDPTRAVHRVELLTGHLACADWVTVGAGHLIPDDKISQFGPRCTTCWPDETKGH